ncbi:MAG: hypothetical protein U0528_14610 [Anaerolineae bacterium]
MVTNNDPSELETAKIRKLNSPFANIYWFARSLINSENGGKGADTKIMLELASIINLELKAEPFDLEVAKTSIRNFFRMLHRANTVAASEIENLIEDLDVLIKTKQDLGVLKFTIEHVLIVANTLLQNVPSSDRKIAETSIRTHLEAQGEAGLVNVIELWDIAGRRGSMEAERIAIVDGFRILRKTLEEMIEQQQITDLDSDQALTAFVQEFERRLSRGIRPRRAGKSLEDVTGVILEHFKVSNFTTAPEHIKTAFEVDKLITLPDAWRIGISCKRTLRERWKQAATLDLQKLDNYKIRNTWHVITYPGDLTQTKVKAIGESRGVVYLPDNSHFYRTHFQNAEISDFIRPMSHFIQDLKASAIPQDK